MSNLSDKNTSLIHEGDSASVIAEKNFTKNFNFQLKNKMRATKARVAQIKNENYEEEVKTIQKSLKEQREPMHADFSSAMF